MPTVYRLLDVAAQFFDDNGDPYAGGKLFTYGAGSSTKKTTYQDSAGVTPHANPIALDSAGRLPAPVFGTTGPYKFVLAPSTDSDPPSSAEWTEDGISGINDTATTSIDQWIESGLTPTYVGATQFTLSGDQTTVFHVGRRVKTTNSGGTRYGRITASSYSAPNTTVTVVNDSGSLDAGLSNVAYGLLSNTSPSVPDLSWVGLQLIGEYSASGGTSLDIESGIDSARFGGYMIRLAYLYPGTNATTLRMRIKSGGSYQTTAYSTALSYVTTAAPGTLAGAAATDGWDLTVASNASSTAANALSAMIWLPNPHDATSYLKAFGLGNYVGSGGGIVHPRYSGYYGAGGGLEGIRFASSSGTVTALAYLYGMRK